MDAGNAGYVKVRMAFIEVRFALTARKLRRACVEASRALDKLSRVIEETNDRTTV